MKKIIALFLALTFIFVLVACEKEAEASEPTPVPSSSEPDEPVPAKKIGISLPTQSLKRWEQDGSSMKAQLEAAGYEVELQYAGDNEIYTQIAQLEEMISGGCDLLVIAPIEGEGLYDVLAGAKEKEIPVIAYERMIRNSDVRLYYAAIPATQYGFVQASFIEEALDLKNSEGPFNIELFLGDPGDSNINRFWVSAMDVLEKYIEEGKLVVKSGQGTKDQIVTVDWSTENAQERMKKMIKSAGYGPDGKKLDAVWCVNDSIAQGVTNALLEAGYTAGENFPIVTGGDCEAVSVKNILAGTQSMSAFVDTRDLVSRTVTMVISIMNGEEPEVNDTEDNYNGSDEIPVPAYLCMPVACTAENYKELLIERGYYTEDELK